MAPVPLPQAADISIHTLRVEGDIVRNTAAKESYISIHTLRVEGDEETDKRALSWRYFNPHPPRGG